MMLRSLPLKLLIPIAAAYGSLVSCLNLFGYWGAFHINVFEYLSFTNLISLSAYPLAGSLLALVIGFALPHVSFGSGLPIGGGADSSIGRAGIKHWRLAVTLLLIAIAAVALFFPEPNRWLLVAALVSFLAAPISHSPFAVALLPAPWLRYWLLYVLILVPGLSFYYGRYEAALVRTGRGELLVAPNRSGLQVRLTANKPVTYLGRLGSHVLIYESSTSSILVVDSTHSPLLVLVDNPARS